MKISDFPIKKDKIRTFNEESDYFRATIFDTELGEVRKMLYYCEQFIEYILQLDLNTRVSVIFKPPIMPDPVFVHINKAIPIDIACEADLDRELECYTIAKKYVALVKELATEDFYLWNIPKWDKKSLKEAGYEFRSLV